MSWPQYTVIALLCLSVGISLGKDGEPKTGEYSFWLTLFSCALHFWLLYMGGFFGDRA